MLGHDRTAFDLSWASMMDSSHIGPAMRIVGGGSLPDFTHRSMVMGTRQ
jgi:hypothetical protein